MWNPALRSSVLIGRTPLDATAIEARSSGRLAFGLRPFGCSPAAGRVGVGTGVIPNILPTTGPATAKPVVAASLIGCGCPAMAALVPLVSITVESLPSRLLTTGWFWIDGF